MKKYLSMISPIVLCFGAIGFFSIVPLAYAEEFNSIEEVINCESGVEKTYQVQQDYDSDTHIEFTVGLECDNLTIDLNGKKIQDGNIRFLNGTKTSLIDSVGGGYLYNLGRTNYASRDSFVSNNYRYEEGEPHSPDPQVKILSGVYKGDASLYRVAMMGGTYNNGTFTTSSVYSSGDNYFRLVGGEYDDITFQAYLNGVFEISGGEYSNVIFGSTVEEFDRGTFKISGGTFDNITFNDEHYTFIITGGSFDVAPDESYIPDGYVISEESGRYVVRQEIDFVAYTVLPLNAPDDYNKIIILGDSDWINDLSLVSSDESVLSLTKSTEVNNFWDLTTHKTGKVTISYAYATYTGSFDINIVNNFDVSDFQEDVQRVPISMMICELSAADNAENTVLGCGANAAIDKAEDVLSAVLSGKRIKINAPSISSTDDIIDEAAKTAKELDATIFAGYISSDEITITDADSGAIISSAKYQGVNQDTFQLPDYLANQEIHVIVATMYQDEEVYIYHETVSADGNTVSFPIYGSDNTYYYFAADSSLFPEEDIKAPNTGVMASSIDHDISTIGFGLSGIVIASFIANYLRKRITAIRRVRF